MKDKIFLRLIPQRIDLLTKIIEAYDHLGVVSTIDSGSGLVIIRGSEDTIPEIKEILNNLPFPVEVLNLDETILPAPVKARE